MEHRRLYPHHILRLYGDGIEAPILLCVPLYCKRRKNTTATNGASIGGPPQALPLSPTWFGNLFRIKLVSFSLLSVHDPDTSREECERILHGLSVRAILIHADGPGLLKCRLDEISDPAGVVGVTKTARFRVKVKVENRRYQTALQLV